MSNEISAIIIDDEQDSVDVIRLMLEMHCPHVKVVATANSADEGMRLIEANRAELVFLDIEMPGKNGIELLGSMQHCSFHTIIISAYERYAIQAIKYSAIDYLLKPLNGEELIAAVAKVSPEKLASDPRLKYLSQLLSTSEESRPEELVIPSANGFEKMTFSDIEYLETKSGNYCLVHKSDGTKNLVTKALTYFEEILPEERFFRIHRSFLVNIKKVSSFDSKRGIARLMNGSELEVATRRRSGFRARLLQR